MSPPFSIYRFVAVLVTSLLLAMGVDAKEKRPNLVVILADDMGYAELGCYGSGHKTPHLDALAKRGMRFTDFHSNGAVCSPTRAALLTGRYQQRAGVDGVIYADPKQNRHHGLQTSEITFAGLLRDAGYTTGCFGKWHLGYDRRFHPPRHGFDHFHGYVSGNIDYHSHFDRMGVYDWWDGEKTVKEKGYSTHLITQHAVRFIEESKDRPFCAYVAHEAPHTPFQGPQDPAFRVAGKVVGETRSPEFKKRAYRQMIEELDRGVGDIVEALERLGLTQSTLVFFLSDNGATGFGQNTFRSNGELRGSKGTLWEGGHRVPAIACWPGTIESGSVCNALTAGFDVLPTLLDLASVKPPEGHAFDGRSLAALLRGEASTTTRQLFWSFGKQRAMRDGHWKLVRGLRGMKKKAPALFDLAADISERRNLASQHPQRVARMARELAKWQRDVAADATVQPSRPKTRGP